MRLIRILLFLPLFGLFSGPAIGKQKIRVVCTLPTLKALAQEVGGDRIEAVALSKGDQDPHTVIPTPVLMRRTREADLFVENGFSLELWADEVVNGSGNSRLFRGAAGRIAAAAGISALEVPAALSREMGDVHPQGNPHVWLDPLLAKAAARNICEALKRIDPPAADYYQKRLEDFSRRIDNALFGPELLKLLGIQKLTRLTWSGELRKFLDSNKLGGKPLSSLEGGWLRKARPLNGVKAVEFHKVRAYFARVFGMQLVGTIEERPGIPPGPQHIRQISDLIRSQHVSQILVDNFYDPSLPTNIARQTGAALVVLPNQVEGEPGIRTYFDLMDYLIERMTSALKKSHE